MEQKVPARQNTRRVEIVALDPSFRVRRDGKKRILTAQVEVPAEALGPGPSGYRVQVIDYDASTNTLYKPSKGNPSYAGPLEDSQILSDPHFHAHNVYAIVMRTLARFEFALGRRVNWGFYGHQLKVAPHAFADANAFYTEDEQALMFGYMLGRRGPIFTCLSHHIVAHETAHALLDGLRQRYTDPSSPEQAAFHEGFADVVALLSIFSLRDVVKAVIDLDRKGSPARSVFKKGRFVRADALTPEKLRNSVLFGLAEEMGQELSGIRGDALRRSATLTPDTRYMDDPEFREPHRRGEILVAAVMNAFIEVWLKRLKDLGRTSPRGLSRDRVVEEGAEVADYLLTMFIRALDYAPPVDLQFCDYLSALLTADREIRPDDSKYNFRRALLDSFERYKMPPTSKGDGGEPGVWHPPPAGMTYERSHFESMQRDPNEVFRFIWENRKALEIYEDAYTRVQSVRPCLRIGPDGFVLKETVAEYIQMIELNASELRSLGIKPPAGMPAETVIKIYGGGALVFDEYGLLKFHVHNRILDAERQAKRLEYLWESDYIQKGASLYRRISHIHRLRALGMAAPRIDEG